MLSLKSILLSVFIFNVALHCTAQIPAIAFQKSLGGSDQDYGTKAHQTADGGFIVIGSSNSSDGNFAVNQGYNDVWVVKFDSIFTIQWKKNYGGTGDDVAMDIKQQNDGSYIFLARTMSNDGDVTGNHGSSDAWVVRLDALGNITWQRCYGGSFHEFSYNGSNNFSLTNDGGFVVATSSMSNDGDVSGHHGAPAETDFWIFKADSTGNIQWQNSYGGTSWDDGFDVQQTFDGGYIVTGDTQSDDGDVTNRPFPGSSYEDYWVVRLDSTGVIQWQKCLGGSDFDIPVKVIQANDSGYVVAGYTVSDDGDVTMNHGDWDGWVVKLDTAGNMMWQTSIGGNWGDQLFDFHPAADGGYFASGMTASTDITGTHGGVDAWIVRLDSSCAIQWQKRIGGTSGETIYSIDTATNGYVACGRSWSSDIDLVSNKGYEDWWIVNLASHSNSITGTVYLDTLTNGVHDAGEPLLSNKLVSELTTGRIAFTDGNGKYDLSVLSPGIFNVQAPAVNYHTVMPSSYPVAFASIDEIDSLNDFPAAPVPGINDLEINLVPLYGFNPGFSGAYLLVCKNVGTTNQSATVKIFPGNYLTYQSATVIPSLISTDSIVWSNINLVPWQDTSIEVIFDVSVFAPVDSIVSTASQIEPIFGDVNIEDNFSGSQIPVTASYDPNDKLVSDTILTTAQLSQQPYLDYIIRFQNTGTAPAVNIMITDNIKPQLDVTTFEFESASHPVQVAYQQSSKLITFYFDNIQLPDSSVNEAASHGFVHYRIKPYDTLSAGTIIRNKAAIFFDFNEPVLTNSVITSIVQPVSIEENQIDFPSLNVYPDPASKELTVLSTEVLSDFTIYDISGRTLVKSELKSRKFLLDVSSFSDGIYLLRVSDGKKQMYKKFVVRR